MKEINIASFPHLIDAMDYLEHYLALAFAETDDVEAEVKFINAQWRVGVTRNGSQKEFDFEECG